MKNMLMLGLMSVFAMSVLSCGMMDKKEDNKKKTNNRNGSRTIVSQVEQVSGNQESTSCCQ